MVVVTPYLSVCGPPEFVPTFPPMVQADWLEGSGAKNSPRDFTAWVTHALTQPASTSARRF